ncbi:MAG: hypothetical protein DMG39_15720 [Acidobacteria bacterium]|nr:MAG: hypothetical protein DMG39_15720 [Acidobacteriota bacterium]
MITKTFWGWFWFVVVLTLASTNLSGKDPRMGAVSENAQMTVSVYNEAGVPVDVLRRGEHEASRIFYRAGIAVHWLNCKVPAPTEEISRRCREVVFPEHLHLRIVRKSVGLKGEAMGISFQTDDGSGCYADLFYEPMEDLQKSDGADLASLLGHVAAHEIGHLLLGTNSHAAAGIMQAHWTSQELTDAAVNRMVFLKEESQRMKERLLTATRVSRENSMGDAP